MRSEFDSDTSVPTTTAVKERPSITPNQRLVTVSSFIATSLILASVVGYSILTNPALHDYHDNDDTPPGRLGGIAIALIGPPVLLGALGLSVLAVALAPRWWPARIAIVYGSLPVAGFFVTAVMAQAVTPA